MIRKVERKIKAKYRKMCGWCFLIALVIGFVLGFLFARLLFPARTQVGSDFDARGRRAGGDGRAGARRAYGRGHAAGDADANPRTDPHAFAHGECA